MTREIHHGINIDTPYQYRTGTTEAEEGEAIYARTDELGYQLVKLASGTVELQGADIGVSGGTLIAIAAGSQFIYGTVQTSGGAGTQAIVGTVGVIFDAGTITSLPPITGTVSGTQTGTMQAVGTVQSVGSTMFSTGTLTSMPNIAGTVQSVGTSQVQGTVQVTGTEQVVGTVTSFEPLPNADPNLSTLLSYDGSSNLGTVIMGNAGGTYYQTLTYTAGALSAVSAWGTL